MTLALILAALASVAALPSLLRIGALHPTAAVASCALALVARGATVALLAAWAAGVAGLHGPAAAFALMAGAGAVQLVRVVRAERAAARALGECTLGPGPRGSCIVGGGGVLLAVAGVLRPRVVVSAGALTVLDDAELEAALEHERGHLVRRHRWLLLAASVASAIGRVVPGAAGVRRELAHHLERDADRYALRRGHDAGALARAIEFAAGAPPVGALGLAHATGAHSARRRIAELATFS